MKFKFFNISNYDDKISGKYTDMFAVQYDTDWYKFVNQICEILNFNFGYLGELISFIDVDQGIINKYNLPFDNVLITIYKAFPKNLEKIRSYYEYEENVIQNTVSRDLYIYLYFSFNELVYDINNFNPFTKHCILKEMNNCFNRDLKYEINKIENDIHCTR